MTTNRQYEEALCIAAFAMAERLRPTNAKIIHIPNGGARGKDAKSSAIIGRRIKAMGARAGVFDYMVLFEDGTYAFVEMKLALKGLRDIVIHKRTGLNQAQKTFVADMTALCGQNFRFAVTRSVDEFIEALTEMGVQWKFRKVKGHNSQVSPLKDMQATLKRVKIWMEDDNAPFDHAFLLKDITRVLERAVS